MIKCRCGSITFRLYYYTPTSIMLVCSECGTQYRRIGVIPFPLEIQGISTPKVTKELKFNESDIAITIAKLEDKIDKIAEKVEMEK